jgi:hypothetical protein
MFAHPREKERAAAARRTHSAAIRTRRGHCLISSLDATTAGAQAAMREYNLTTRPTSHGLLPMSPKAMLAGRNNAALPYVPPNVMSLLRSGGHRPRQTPRAASAPLCVRRSPTCPPPFAQRSD